MNILVTGAAGFVGKNLLQTLYAIRDGKNKACSLQLEQIDTCNSSTSVSDLELYCSRADFVFHLAGVNRASSEDAFVEGNVRFTTMLLDALQCHNNYCPIMFASSIQASLVGRYEGSKYGKTKLEAESLLFRHAARTGAPVYVYRLPNLFGKWSRPNYNSVVATFCHNIAHDLPIRIDDTETELELLYIDDLIETLLQALCGMIIRCDYDGITPVHKETGAFCAVPETHRVTLGKLAALLKKFRAMPVTLQVPHMPKESFVRKLYATYLSYLPQEAVCFPLTQKSDSRGSFTELLKTDGCGQFSLNISKPGMTKGQHWHHSKWELFIVLSGTGLVRQRKIGSDEVWEFPVSGDRPEAVYMLPGFTHSLVNLSETEDLITLMWANEVFDPEKPDTVSEPV